MSGGRRVMEAALVSYEMHDTPKRSDLEWPRKSKIPSRRKKPPKTFQYGDDIIKYQQATPRINVCEVVTETLHEKFNRLLAEWREQAAHLSSINAKVMVPAYLEMIGMGQPALRLILNELKERPTYLFPALRAITGIDPVPPEDRGRISRMANAWIEWGRQRKIIK